MEFQTLWLLIKVLKLLSGVLAERFIAYAMEHPTDVWPMLGKGLFSGKFNATLQFIYVRGFAPGALRKGMLMVRDVNQLLREEGIKYGKDYLLIRDQYAGVPNAFGRIRAAVSNMPELRGVELLQPDIFCSMPSRRGLKEVAYDPK
ncbi:hypothetical protein HYU17_05980 [Candidatus Woesearchaeota archaeon]|nr:hypothetical protein [Candidatus Woesearchaeota archaeon]